MLTKEQMARIADEVLRTSELNYTAYQHMFAYLRQLLIEAQEKALAAVAAESKERP